MSSSPTKVEYKTISDLIGNTPLIRLRRMPGPTNDPDQNNNVILVKLEGNNPGGSVKDRAATSMIKGAEERGELRPDRKHSTYILEATSGNTGIGLAMAAAISGYKCRLIMPENQTEERKATMRAYGAELILTPKSEGMEGARDLAERLIKEQEERRRSSRREQREEEQEEQKKNDGDNRQQEESGEIQTLVWLNQFSNLDNPGSHFRSTGPEIWRDTQGTVTHFVSAAGTTGSIMGTSKFLKSQNENIQIIKCEPSEGSTIPGIRKWPEAYLPKIYDASRIDRTEQVTQHDAEETARRLAREEGIFCGISSGGAVAVALRVAETVKNATIVTIICDRGDRYLSTGVF